MHELDELVQEVCAAPEQEARVYGSTAQRMSVDEVTEWISASAVQMAWSMARAWLLERLMGPE